MGAYRAESSSGHHLHPTSAASGRGSGHHGTRMHARTGAVDDPPVINVSRAVGAGSAVATERTWSPMTPPAPPPPRRSAAPWLLVGALAVAAVVVVGWFLWPRSSASTPESGPEPDRTSAAAPPSRATVPVHGAELAIPRGWRVVPYQQRTGHTTIYADAQCIVGADATGDDCTILFGVFLPERNPMDVDYQGGLAANAAFCNDTRTDQDWSGAAGVRDLGGRESEWRHWTIDCGGERVIEIEQYVVATGPSFVLYSAKADPSVAAAMKIVADESRLPARSQPVRLMDRGIVTAVRDEGGALVITLDRIRVNPDEHGEPVLNDSHRTFEYTVAQSVVSQSGRPRVEVGSTVIVQSDGEKVTNLFVSA